MRHLPGAAVPAAAEEPAGRGDASGKPAVERLVQASAGTFDVLSAHDPGAPALPSPPPRGASRPPPAATRVVRIPKQARARLTREKVLEAAVECFENTGYDETTTAMIASRAGIGVGTLYGYFRDKREILIEILDRTVAEVGRMVVERLDPEGFGSRDPRTVARELIDAVFHMHNHSPGLQRILWERYLKDETFRVFYDEIRARTRVAIEKFIDTVAAGGLLRDIDREQAPFVLLNAVQWNATQAFLRGNEEQIDATAHATADMVAAYLFR